MTAQLIQVVLLLANTGFTLLIALLLMRFFMQLFRAPFDSPIGAFILHLTNWLVLPLRRIVPAIRGFDSASLLAAYLLQILLLTLVISLTTAYAIANVGTMLQIALSAFLALLRLTLYIFVILLVAQAILSWFNPNPYTPLNRLVVPLTDPALRPLRRIIPAISGIDLTPLVAILLVQIILIFLG